MFSALFALMFIVVLTTSGILFFTPVREYIPGYSSTSLQKQAERAERQTDQDPEEMLPGHHEVHRRFHLSDLRR